MQEGPLWEKYALTIQEASALFHIGEHKMLQAAWKSTCSILGTGVV